MVNSFSKQLPFTSYLNSFKCAFTVLKGCFCEMMPIVLSIWCIDGYYTIQAAWATASLFVFEFIFVRPFWFSGVLYVFFLYKEFVIRQKQIALKKRQWHEANGSQQPDWGKQLCVNWEQFGFTGLGATLEGGRRSFGGTRTSLDLRKMERAEIGRHGRWMLEH